MKLAIVGPGLMEIPPKGWGAVEIVIHEYSMEMRRLGWEVRIINTKARREIVRQVNEWCPDFVHIHYDEYAGLARSFECKAVAVTSHFGYLDQVWRFPKYRRRIHQPILDDEHLHVFALSPSIADIYICDGKPEAMVRVLPNGVRTSAFRVSERPSRVTRSICLGRIEPRKQQGLLQAMKLDIDFVGNVGDASGEAPFDMKAPDYLGPWTKQQVHDQLTEYSNLVLLSDGEAHPLVVSEALASGLGVVVSEAAAANIDRSLPFVSVVPRDRVGDRRYVSEVISANREAAAVMRSEIVEYAKGLDWSIAAQAFDSAIRAIINGPTRKEVVGTQAVRRIAVLTIATGAYFDRFFGDLASSIEANFCKDAVVEVFCFTDKEAQPREGVTFINCQRLGWPFDTLLRFQRFQQIKDTLKAFDLLVYIDADMRVERAIASHELWHDFFAVAHPGYLPPRSIKQALFGTSLSSFEMDERSGAFVPAGKGSYVQGCFFGGKREPFLYMIDRLSALTADDLRKGDVPVWHDEFFLNRFMQEHTHTVVSYTFAYPEGWSLPGRPAITHRQKTNSVMRGENLEQLDVSGILAGNNDALNHAYRDMYLRSHEKTQRLERYLRAYQSVRLHVALRMRAGIRAVAPLARRINRRIDRYLSGS